MKMYQILMVLVDDDGNTIKEHEIVSFGAGTMEHMAIAAVDVMAVRTQGWAKESNDKARAMRKPLN